MNCKKCKHCGEIGQEFMECENPVMVNYIGKFPVSEMGSDCDFFVVIETPEDWVKPTMQTLPSGGKQAKEDYDYSILPNVALHHIVLNMTKGAEVYGVENYLNIPMEVNASRAIAHLQLARMTEDERKQFSDEDILRHLINGATRALFALDCHLRGGAKENKLIDLKKGRE